ncbi:MAG: SGNH/GDSL hydrolase family protein [Acidobacteriota bacterium]|nr:SGNH/GDSL hydrolase family protein [Acidobacteriota bacterium]
MKYLGNFFLLCLILVGAAWPAQALQDSSARWREWEPEIQAFEDADKSNPPAEGAVLFIGSSSIRLWQSLAQDFPLSNVLNRGFGGAHIEDSTHFADRIIIPYHPRLIVLYAGDNDIESGKTPLRVLEDFKQFVGTVFRLLSRTRVAFISIKPSPARWRLVDRVRKANKLIEKFIRTDRRLDYIDVFSPMLGKDGKPRSELYVEDNLHMSKEGYELWRSLVAPHIR